MTKWLRVAKKGHYGDIFTKRVSTAPTFSGQHLAETKFLSKFAHLYIFIGGGRLMLVDLHTKIDT